MIIFYNDTKGILRSYWFLFNCLIVSIFTICVIARSETYPSYKEDYYLVWFMPVTFAIPTISILFALRKYWFLPIKDNRIYIELLQKYSRRSIIYQKLLSVYFMNLVYFIIILACFVTIATKSESSVAYAFRAYGVSLLCHFIYTPIIFSIFLVFYSFKKELVCILLAFFISFYAVATTWIAAAGTSDYHYSFEYLTNAKKMNNLKQDERFTKILNAITSNNKQELNSIIIPSDMNLTKELEEYENIESDIFQGTKIFDVSKDLVRENNMIRLSDKFFKYIWLINYIENWNERKKQYGLNIYSEEWSKVYFAFYDNIEFKLKMITDAKIVYPQFSTSDIYKMLIMNNMISISIDAKKFKSNIRASEVFNSTNPFDVMSKEKDKHSKILQFYIPLVFMQYMSTIQLINKNDMKYYGFEALHKKLRFVTIDDINFGVDINHPTTTRPLWVAIFVHSLISLLCLLGIGFIVKKLNFK